MNEFNTKSLHNESVQYPKVLLINIQSIGFKSATGQTLQNLFESWPKKKLMQICLDINTDNYCNTIVNTFYMEPSWIPYENIFRKIYKIFTNDKYSQTQINTGLNSGITDKSILGKMHDFIRGILDISPIFLPLKVISQIEQFKPDIIYTMGATIRTLKLSNRLAKNYNIPICLHLMDNWIDTKYSSSIIVKPIRNSMLKQVKKLHRYSNACIAISPKMAEYYQNRYGIRYYNAMNCIKNISENLSREDDGCIRLLYAGGLHLNRWKSLLLIAKCLTNLDINKFNIEIIAYIPEVDKNNFGKLLSKSGIIIKDFVPQNQMEKVLESADIFLLLESFDDNIIPFTIYSMSTKVPEYMAAGRPILSFSPRILTSSQYIESTESGIVVENQKELDLAIKMLIADKEKRIKMAKNGVNTAKKYHTKTIITKTMLQALNYKKKEVIKT